MIFGERWNPFGILHNLERYLISIYLIVVVFLSHMVYSSSAQEQGNGFSLFLKVDVIESIGVLFGLLNGVNVQLLKSLLWISRLQEDPPVGVSGAPSENNIMQWNAVIFG